MPKIIKKHGKTALIFGLILAILTMFLVIPESQAASIANREMKLSDSRPGNAGGTGVTYDFEGDFSNTTVYCLRVQYCTTATGTCTKPTGMVTTSATKDSGNWAGFTAGSWTIVNTTDGETKYTNVSGEAPSPTTNASLSTGTITNSSTSATAFARVTTYTNTDCATGSTDTGVAAFAIISGISVTATVAETLTFSIAAVGSGSGETVNGATTNVTTTTTGVAFGELSTGSNKIGAHDLTVSTNATGGYTTTVAYTQKLRIDVSNDIDDHSGTNAAPTTFSGAGTEAFGYTTEDSSLGTGTADRFTSAGGNKWAGFSTTPYEVAYSSAPVSSQTIRTGYQVGISGTTTAGDYSTTVIYVCTPIY